jgi:hypothetical protein
LPVTEYGTAGAKLSPDDEATDAAVFGALYPRSVGALADGWKKLGSMLTVAKEGDVAPV